MKAVSKAIYIEWRYPKNKVEQGLYGLTEYDNRYVAKVFINTQASRKHLTDTFFHEMTHVFLALHRRRGKMHSKREEALAKQVGQTCAYLLK